MSFWRVGWTSTVRCRRCSGNDWVVQNGCWTCVGCGTMMHPNPTQSATPEKT